MKSAHRDAGQLTSLACSVLLAACGTAQAALSISNGDFEIGGGANIENVTGWYDFNGGNFWEGTWQSNAQTPNGSNLAVFSSLEADDFGVPTPDVNEGGYLYQSIGIADGLSSVQIQFDWGSPTDDPGGRNLGMTVGIYAYDGQGGFTPADGTDVRGATGVTLLDSASFAIPSTTAGGQIGSEIAELDLTGAGQQELFLRFNNYLPSSGESWPVLDNIGIAGSPEPSRPGPLTNAFVRAEPFSPERIRLLESRFKDVQEMHRTGYLAWLDPDRLLYPYRQNAGLSTQGASSLGGWDGDPGSSWGANACRGHMLGHYLSAASRMVASAGDTNYLAKLNYIVTELRVCQDALAASEPVYGYLAGVPSSNFDTLETNPTSALVPFYTIHKTLAGLVDVYKYCGIDLALDIAISMSDYHSWRVDQLSDSQIEAMFRTDNGNSEEWGGMNEALSEIYLLSNARGDSNAVRHVQFAQVFHRDWFINPLEADIDQLSGLHANTHVPQVVGFAHTAAMLATNDTERVRLYAAADNFWHMVTENHSFVLGGNSYAEHFSAPGLETGTGGAALSWNTAETCNTYNMLKLTGELLQHEPSVEYADYYERALYSHLLASISPVTGMTTYFVSMDPGHFKTYGLPTNSCWCCTGTGLENPAGYGQYIYLHKEDALWLNLYIPSTLNWSEKGIHLALSTDYPQSETIQITLDCVATVQAKVRLRIPSWIASSATVAVNDVVQGVTATAGTYVELDRTWNDGDVITLTLPMGLRLDHSMDDPSQVSLFYGPVLLAGDLGTNNMPGNAQQTEDQWDHQGVPRVSTPSLIASDASDLAAWVHPTSTSLVFTADAAFVGATNRGAVLLRPFYDTHHTRYSVYWNLVAPTGLSTWNGGGGPSLWSESGNWDVPPSANHGLRFAASAGGTSQNDLGSGTVFNGLQFMNGAGAFTIDGNAIGLEGDVLNTSSNEQSINLPIALQEGLPWYFDAEGADITLSGPLTGSGTVVKQGPNGLKLLSNASFNGSINVVEGNLEIGNGGAFGSLGSVPVDLGAGTALFLDRSDAFSVEAAITGSGAVHKRGSGTMDLLVPLENAGSLHVDAGIVRIASGEKPGLTHRWSFSGDLTDSVGGATAQVVNVGPNNTTLTSTEIELSGGSRNSSDYVQLGSGLFPKDGSAATIELWATPEAFQTWSRIFAVGASDAENLFMAWSQASSTADRVEWKDVETSTVNSSYAPLDFGKEYHIALVIAPGAGSGGTTLVTWYVASSAAASLGSAKGSFQTANTLAALDDVHFWLGRSHYGADATASARYNEVRIWNHALSAGELEQLHALGPDSLLVSGALSPTADVSIGAGARLELDGGSQLVASLAGEAGATLDLGADGHLVIGIGGDPAATFAGDIVGTGSIQVDGVLRLVGSATLAPGVMLINGGTLDIMTWNGTLPPGFVNNATLLDQGVIQADALILTNNNVVATIHGYPGHDYQLQYRQNLKTGAWQDCGDAAAGNDTLLELIHPGGVTASNAFYRIRVSP